MQYAMCNKIRAKFLLKVLKRLSASGGFAPDPPPEAPSLDPVGGSAPDPC